MATKEMYERCCEALRNHRECRISGKTGESRRVLEPDMDFLFGKKELVGEVELMNLSESEKRRHFMEDHVLWSTYIKLYSDRHSPVYDPNMAALA